MCKMKRLDDTNSVVLMKHGFKINEVAHVKHFSKKSMPKMIFSGDFTSLNKNTVLTF